MRVSQWPTEVPQFVVCPDWAPCPRCVGCIWRERRLAYRALGRHALWFGFPPGSDRAFSILGGVGLVR
eukprot:7208382-Alexandrium_andersonii.AAC.1